MSLFGTHLAKHLAAELDIDVKTVEHALSTFGKVQANGKKEEPAQSKTADVKTVAKTGNASTAKATAAKPTVAKAESKPAEKSTAVKAETKPAAKVDAKKVVEQHFCERVKRGQPDPCGKNAKNYIDKDGK